MADKYKVIRTYFDAEFRHRTIRTGLTLEQAKAHCRDPETSSETCKRAENVLRTKQCGLWFDCFEPEEVIQ